MPRIPLYQPKQVEFGGGQTPRIPLSAGNTALVVNPREMVRGRDAQVQAMTNTAQTIGQVSEQRTRSLEEKFAALSQIGDTVNQMGWRMFDLSQEANYNSNMAKAREFILGEKEKALQNPNLTVAMQELNKTFSEAEGDYTAGLVGLKRAQARTTYHDLSLRAAIDVRAKAREKTMGGILAADREQLQVAKKEAIQPGVDWGRRVELFQERSAKLRKMAFQGLITEEQWKRGEADFWSFLVDTQVEAEIRRDPVGAYTTFLDPKRNPDLTRFLGYMSGEQRYQMRGLALVLIQNQNLNVAKGEKAGEDKRRMEQRFASEIAGRAIVRGEMDLEGLKKLRDQRRISQDHYQTLSEMLGKGREGPGNERLFNDFFGRIASSGISLGQGDLTKEILEACSQGGLNGNQVDRLLDQIQLRLKPNDISRGSGYQQAVKSLKEKLTAPGETGLYQDRLGQALEEFDRRVRQGEDLNTVLKEVMKRYEPIKDVLKTLQAPRFGTLGNPQEALRLTFKAYERGELTPKKFDEEMVKIWKIARALEQLDDREARSRGQKGI